MFLFFHNFNLLFMYLHLNLIAGTRARIPKKEKKKNRYRGLTPTVSVRSSSS